MAKRKRKLSKKKRRQKRLQAQKTYIENADITKKEKKEKEKYQLPVKVIKKDLVKNLLFAVFSLLVLLLLKQNNINFEYLLNIFR